MCDLKMESQECHPWRRKGELASVFMLLLFFYMCFKTGLAPAQTLLQHMYVQPIAWLLLLT